MAQLDVVGGKRSKIDRKVLWWLLGVAGVVGIALVAAVIATYAPLIHMPAPAAVAPASHRAGTGIAGFGFAMMATCFVMYFLPSFIARGKRNAAAIFALNLLLGWTLLGWVVSLVWALVQDDSAGGRS